MDTGRTPAPAFEALKRMVQEHRQGGGARDRTAAKARGNNEIQGATRASPRSTRDTAQEETGGNGEGKKATGTRQIRERLGEKERKTDASTHKRHVGRNVCRTQIQIGGEETYC